MTILYAESTGADALPQANKHPIKTVFSLAGADEASHILSTFMYAVENSLLPNV